MDKRKNSIWMLGLEDGELKLNPYLDYVKKKKRKNKEKKGTFGF